MMNSFRFGLVLLALTAIFPVESQAQLFGRRHGNCHKCQKPIPNCVCGGCTTCAQPVQQTTYQPVIETQYVQQPVVQERDVITTEYRSEPVSETVPTTAYDSVTVDEGVYQTVWVPRPVTKQVARTVYQQRTSYRTVPYQVTRRVAECTTQSVPYQAVRYVPTTTTAILPGTTPALGLSASAYPTTVAANPPTSWRPVAAPSSTGALPPTPVVANPAAPANGLAPLPDANFRDGAPTTTAIMPITPRVAANEDVFGEYQPAPNSAPIARQADRGPSLFVPAPTAAMVWRSARGTALK